MLPGLTCAVKDARADALHRIHDVRKGTHTQHVGGASRDGVIRREQPAKRVGSSVQRAAAAARQRKGEGQGRSSDRAGFAGTVRARGQPDEARRGAADADVRAPKQEVDGEGNGGARQLQGAHVRCQHRQYFEPVRHDTSMRYAVMMTAGMATLCA